MSRQNIILGKETIDATKQTILVTDEMIASIGKLLQTSFQAELVI
jgi:hypothetical protein